MLCFFFGGGHIRKIEAVEGMSVYGQFIVSFVQVSDKIKQIDNVHYSSN